VVVPDDLIGLTESEARRKLTDAGLRVQVIRREDATMAPGTVIEAEPGPGSQVDENSVVRIVVATAPRPSPPRSSQTDGNG
jgi:beta-lactam-binding protein with PASTA domain